MTELADVAAALYGLPLEEFTATRDTRAKELRADGERALATAVKGLRRPSTAAWAVNQLVRARGDEVEQVLELGAALREAQAALAGDELRALSRQQHQLVGAVARRARAVARERGQRLSEGVVREVEATLKAAMAHVDAAAAVRSGLLLRALENTGFTSVDLDGAVALPDAIPAHGGRPQLRVVRDKDTDSGETDGETVDDGDPADDGAAAEQGPDDGPDTGAGGRATRRTSGARSTKGTRRRADDERAAEDEHRRAAQARRRAEEEERRRAEEDERRRREEAERAEERRREEAERAAERRRAREEAEAAAARADEERAAAQEALDEAERTVDDLAHRRGEVRERIADLRRRLDEAEREDDDVSTRLNDARSAREDAASALRAAARAADRARSRLEDLPDP